MGYVRTNEDYDISRGCSPREAAINAELDRQNLDPGFCNPRKVRDYEEARKEAERNVRERERE